MNNWIQTSFTPLKNLFRILLVLGGLGKYIHGIPVARKNSWPNYKLWYNSDKKKYSQDYW